MTLEFTRVRPVLQLVISLICSLAFTWQVERAIAITISNIYAFGDSSSDVGNRLPDATHPSPPYWNGRYSNGPVWIDYLASEFGLSMSPSKSGGNNHAIGGATTASVLTWQIPQFSAAHAGEADPNALYTINLGAADLVGGVNPATAADNIRQAVVDLSNLGAELFLVVNMIDLAQRPAYLNSSYAHDVTVAFNQALALDLTPLTGITVFEVDAFEFANQVVSNPAMYGLSDVTHSCLSGLTPCSTPETFLWWDYPGHPTTDGHRVMNMSALAALPKPGDYNQDLVVNEQDYDTWKAAFGSTVNRFLGADGNGDGIVDAADYTVWRDNFGAATPGSAAGRSGANAWVVDANIPEPTAASLLLLGGVAVVGYCGRGKNERFTGQTATYGSGSTPCEVTMPQKMGCAMRWLATSAVVVANAWLAPTLALAYTFGDWASDHGYSPGAMMPTTVDAASSSIDSLSGIGDYDWTSMPTTGLRLSNNQLSSIPPGTLTGLTNLQWLDLNNNQLSRIEPGTFDGLTNLIELTLEGNRISTIEPNAFRGLTNLYWLYLEDNQLSRIEVGAFNGLTNLVRLDLYDNRLRSIETASFDGPAYLGFLDLHNNKLTSIEAGAFHWARYLNYLDLHNNPALTELNLAEADFSNFGFGFGFLDVGGNANVSRVSLESAVVVQDSLATLLDGGWFGFGVYVLGVGIGELPGVTELDLSHVDFANITDLAPLYVLDNLTDLRLVGTRNLDAVALDVLLNNLATIEGSDAEGTLYMTQTDYDAFNGAGGGLLAAWDAELGHHVEFVTVPEPTFLGLLLAGTAVVGFLRTRKT